MAKVTIDTNLLVYAIDNVDLSKHQPFTRCWILS